MAPHPSVKMAPRCNGRDRMTIIAAPSIAFGLCEDTLAGGLPRGFTRFIALRCLPVNSPADNDLALDYPCEPFDSTYSQRDNSVRRHKASR